MSRFDFANYRNLARRAQNQNDVVGEIHLLRKCLDVLGHSEPISRDTLAEVVNRIAKLENKG